VQVRGFQVRYQAIGSHVVQYSNVLSSSTFSHYITRLHENTAYDVCVNVYTVDEVAHQDIHSPIMAVCRWTMIKNFSYVCYLLTATFHVTCLYSYAAVDKVSTDLVRRAVPLR